MFTHIYGTITQNFTIHDLFDYIEVKQILKLKYLNIVHNNKQINIINMEAQPQLR